MIAAIFLPGMESARPFKVARGDCGTSCAGKNKKSTTSAVLFFLGRPGDRDLDNLHYPFKHAEMNFLRSSPLRSPASFLQVFILSCCAVNFSSEPAVPWSAWSPLRHSDMNFLRSSPVSFLSPASLLHVLIFCCCLVSVFSSAAVAATGNTRQVAISSLLNMGLPSSESLNPMRVASASS